MKRNIVAQLRYIMLTERAPACARFHARLVNKLTFIQINIIRFDSVTRVRITCICIQYRFRVSGRRVSSSNIKEGGG